MLLLLGMPIFVGILDVIVPDSSLNWMTYASLAMVYVFAISIFGEQADSRSDIIGGVLIGLVSYTFLLSNQATFMSREETFLNFYYTAGEVLSRAKMSGLEPDIAMCMSHAVEYKSSLSDRSNNFIAMVGELTSDFRGMVNTSKFYKLYMGEEVNFCSREQYDSIIRSEEFIKMPIFPKEGSVRMIDGVIMVKNTDKVY